MLRRVTFGIGFSLFWLTIGLEALAVETGISPTDDSKSGEFGEKVEGEAEMEETHANADTVSDEGSAGTDGADHEMNDVVVTATRGRSTRLNTTVPVDAVRRREIEERMSGNVGEAVEETPGVALNSPAGGYFTNPNIRGLGGRRVILLIDGRRVDTEKTMGVTGYFVGMNDIERIEIVRGPGSVLYGSDALGGVVNLITIDPLQQGGLTADYRLTVGSNNSEIGNFTGFGWANERFGVRASAWLREADNYNTGNGKHVMNSFYRDRIFSLKLAYRPHPRHTLRLLGDVYLGENIGKAENGADREKYRRVTFPEDRHYMTMLSYEGVDLADRVTKLHLSGYFDFTDRHQRMAFYTEDYSRQVTDKHKYGDFMTVGATVFSTFTFWENNDLTFGGDTWHKFLSLKETTQAVLPGIEAPMSEARPLDDTRQFGGGVFLQDEQRFGEKWKLSGGVRWDGIENEYPEKDEKMQTDFDQAVSGNLGLLYQPIRSMSLTLNGGRAFRSPTLKEKFVEVSSCKGDLCGSPDVRPETSWNIDAGLKGYWKFLTYEFYFFNVFITDYITLRESDRDNCQYEYTNIGKAWLIGGESRLTFDFDHIYKNLGIKFWTSASYVRGEDRNSSDPLPQIPPLRAQAGIRFYGGSAPVLKRFYVEALGRYNARQDRVAPGSAATSDVEKPTGSYFLADASLGFRFRPFDPGIAVSTFLKVANIADTSYRDHLSTVEGMGRNIKIGLAVHY